MAGTPHFVRPPLADATRQVRLLEIIREGDNLSYTDLIRCRLTVHTLADMVGKFTAISYTWGPDVPPKEIVINDHPVVVRTNCWYALWQMRLHDVASTHCERSLYWIDSISIDQDHHAEKGQQISQMASIYSGAGLVAVCLGFPGQDSCLFPSRKGSAHRKSCTNGYQDAISHLSQRSYFQRVWTVQECTLAKRIVAFCGSICISWHTVAVMVAKSANSRGLQVYFQPAKPHSLDSLVRFPRKLLQNLKRKCFDPRDKLYGILHLSRDFLHIIKPDYGKALSAVLLDYVHACVSLYNWHIFPDSLSLLINSIRSLALTFAHESLDFTAQLQVLLSSGSFHAADKTWNLPPRSLTTDGQQSSMMKIYYPVNARNIPEHTNFVPSHEHSRNIRPISAANKCPWSLPSQLAEGRTSCAESIGRTQNAICMNVDFPSEAAAGGFPRDQVFLTSTNVQHEDCLLSFGDLTFVARDNGHHNGLQVIGECVARRHDVDYQFAQLQALRDLELRKSPFVCEFQLTPSEFLALSLLVEQHSQVLRILCNDFMSGRGVRILCNPDEVHGFEEADFFDDIYYDETPWDSTQRPVTLSSRSETPRAKPELMINDDKLSQANCCGFVDPVWLTLDGKAEGGRMHRPSCPWLQKIKPFSWTPEVPGAETAPYKEDRDWITKFPPS